MRSSGQECRRRRSQGWPSVLAEQWDTRLLGRRAQATSLASRQLGAIRPSAHQTVVGRRARASRPLNTRHSLARSLQRPPSTAHRRRAADALAGVGSREPPHAPHVRDLQAQGDARCSMRVPRPDISSPLSFLSPSSPLMWIRSWPRTLRFRQFGHQRYWESRLGVVGVRVQRRVQSPRGRLVATSMALCNLDFVHFGWASL